MGLGVTVTWGPGANLLVNGWGFAPEADEYYNMKYRGSKVVGQATSKNSERDCLPCPIGSAASGSDNNPLTYYVIRGDVTVPADYAMRTPLTVSRQ